MKTVFSCFQGPKRNLNIFKKCCSNRTKKLHNIPFLFWILFAQNRLNIHNQLCFALLETPPCATSIQWLCIPQWGQKIHGVAFESLKYLTYCHYMKYLQNTGFLCLPLNFRLNKSPTLFWWYKVMSKCCAFLTISEL